MLDPLIDLSNATNDAALLAALREMRCTFAAKGAAPAKRKSETPAALTRAPP
jgi:hypothetical protein